MPPGYWMSGPPRCRAPGQPQHCCRAIALTSRSARRPGVARVRACMATRKVHAKHLSPRTGPGWPGQNHGATLGNRPNCFSPATGSEEDNACDSRSETVGLAGPAGSARAYHRCPPCPCATRPAKAVNVRGPDPVRPACASRRFLPEPCCMDESAARSPPARAQKKKAGRKDRPLSARIRRPTSACPLDDATTTCRADARDLPRAPHPCRGQPKPARCC